MMMEPIKENRTYFFSFIYKPTRPNSRQMTSFSCISHSSGKFGIHRSEVSDTCLHSWNKLHYKTSPFSVLAK